MGKNCAPKAVYPRYNAAESIPDFQLNLSDLNFEVANKLEIEQMEKFPVCTNSTKYCKRLLNIFLVLFSKRKELHAGFFVCTNTKISFQTALTNCG